MKNTGYIIKEETMNKSIGIIGNDFKLSTLFVEKIILNTKANVDQDHIPMNIVINNKLLEKDESEIKNLLNKLEQSNTSYLILTFNNIDVYNKIKRNTYIPVINNNFNINDDNFIKQVIELTRKEVKQ